MRCSRRAYPSPRVISLLLPSFWRGFLLRAILCRRAEKVSVAGEHTDGGYRSCRRHQGDRRHQGNAGGVAEFGRRLRAIREKSQDVRHAGDSVVGGERAEPSRGHEEVPAARGRRRRAASGVCARPADAAAAELARTAELTP